MALSVVIEPGQQTRKVRYTAAGVELRGDPTIKHLFAYVLAPARSWAGFGGLDLTIHVPDDCQVLAGRP
jgi:hypothetical protein